MDTLRFVLSNDNLALFPDYLQRVSVLSALAYIEIDRAGAKEASGGSVGDITVQPLTTPPPSAVVNLKGRVACEVNTCDELLLTEIVFEDVEPA